jgi:ribonuclease HI
MIDNVRFVANDEAKLWSVWRYFLAICRDIGITVGETSPPHTNEYVFLGCRYHPQLHVSVGEKILRKLSMAKQMINDGNPVPLVDLQSAFGVCVFAAYALHMPQYFTIKFMRRVIRRDAAVSEIWPCIRKPWLDWIAALVDRRFYPTQRDTDASVVVAYSDASPKGWGGVFFVLGKTFIIGAPWSLRIAEDQHINVMELMAARNALRHISAMLHGVVSYIVDLYVDNTTAKSWLSKQRSKTYVANDILLELSSNDGFRCLRSVSWISTSENVADYASRHFEE